MITTNLNPSSENYKQYYIDDTNIFSVTSQLGITILADLQQDIIETDDSLMPFSDIKKEYINTVPKAFDSSYFIKSSSHPNA